jgi:hypothetical protein
LGLILCSETLDLSDVLVPAGSMGESSLVGALSQGIEHLSILIRDLVTRENNGRDKKSQSTRKGSVEVSFSQRDAAESALIDGDHA